MHTMHTDAFSPMDGHESTPWDNPQSGLDKGLDLSVAENKGLGFFLYTFWEPPELYFLFGKKFEPTSTLRDRPPKPLLLPPATKEQ